MDAKSQILSPAADDLRQLIICDTDFSEAGETDLNVDTMQRLEQLGWLAEGEESGEYALTNAGRLAVRRALGDVVAFVQSKADRAGRTYIAGPMTGYDDFNYPAFNAAAAQMRSMGIAAINPADHGVVPGAAWEDYLRSDIAQLATCESIYFLPGWSKSRGALLEQHIATSLGMQLLFADGAEKPEAVRLRDELRERTSSSQWAANGSPDPHGDRYACERAALAMGDLTDDELANAVFMHGNEQPSIADLMAGKAFLPIAYLTAAKDRIRWLSRALVAAQVALAARQPVEQQPAIWVSPGQLAMHGDRAPGNGGHYLPCRLTRDGEFTQPLYPSPRGGPAQAMDLGQLERIRNELHAMSKQVPDDWADPIIELQRDVQSLIESGKAVGNG